MSTREIRYKYLAISPGVGVGASAGYRLADWHVEGAQVLERILCQDLLKQTVRELEGGKGMERHHRGREGSLCQQKKCIPDGS